MTKSKKYFISVIYLFLTFHFSESIIAQQHFIPIWTNNPYLPMNIYISSALLDSLPLTAGDEIGIFDGDLCVGSSQLAGNILPGNPLPIVASSDDPLTPQKDGFTPGNTISFKIWDVQNQREIFNCLAEYQIGNGTFIPLGTALADLNSFSYLKISPLKVLIEGLYDGMRMVPDTIKVELRNSVAPYELLDSIYVTIDSAGTAICTFSGIELSRNFYIAIKHRNSIETWSKYPMSFTQPIIEYDFTSDSTQAYGNNLTYKAGKWCIYSGDVNQDGVIDSVDFHIVYNGNVLGLNGYYSEDVNYDEYVEVYDLVIQFINKSKGKSLRKP